MRSKKIKSSFVVQQDQSDCGVACLSSIVRYYGGDVSLEVIREKSGTTRKGTTLLGLYQAANSFGLNAEGCKATIPSLIEHGKPAILHLLLENQVEHFVVFYKFDNGLFIIGDPKDGIVCWSADELESKWKSKICLTVEPNNNFVRVSELNKEKKKWLYKLLYADFGALAVSVVIGLIIVVLGFTLAIFTQQLI